MRVSKMYRKFCSLTFEEHQLERTLEAIQPVESAANELSIS